jgi:type IV secretion system protein VirD4
MRPEPLGTRERATPVGLGAGEKLLAVALAVIAAAGAFAWVVGQLAGLLFARTWLHVGAADMAEVLWHLPKHPGDPALAWPARFRSELPGPVGMYLCTALVVGALVGLTDLVIRLWPGPRAPRLGVPLLPRRHHYRAAAWATGWELRRLRVRRPTPGRVIIGRTRGLAPRLLAAEDCHSLFIFGPTGSLKTTGVVIPEIREWTGPLVATSVKPDVIRATRAHRERRGEVLVIDPLGHSGLPAAQWSPLAACGTWQDAQTMAGIIADTATTLSDRPTDEVKYWRTLGTKLLAPMLYAAAYDGRTMADVVRWVDTREEKEVIDALEHAGVEGAAIAWEASQQRTEKARDSVYGTAEELLAIYADERVQAFTEAHDLDVAEFLAGDNTVYLYAPAHEQRRLRPLFETVAMQIVRAAQEKAARAPDGMLDPRLLLALDEAGNVAALAELPELATTGRGQGIQLVSVWHDLAQLHHRYNDRAATVLNNHRAKLFLSGLADLGALELGSKLIGEQAVVEAHPASDSEGRYSVSESTTYRPLVPVEQLRRLKPGHGILLYGHLRPTQVRLRPYFWRAEQRRYAHFERRERAARDRRRLRELAARDRVGRRVQRRRQRAGRYLPGWLQASRREAGDAR